MLLLSAQADLERLGHTKASAPPLQPASLELLTRASRRCSASTAARVRGATRLRAEDLRTMISELDALQATLRELRSRSGLASDKPRLSHMPSDASGADAADGEDGEMDPTRWLNGLKEDEELVAGEIRDEMDAEDERAARTAEMDKAIAALTSAIEVLIDDKRTEHQQVSKWSKMHRRTDLVESCSKRWCRRSDSIQPRAE